MYVNKHLKGKFFESIVANKLISQDFKIIYQNFLIPKVCEIDIIAVKNRTIYFVEVRGRNNSYLGDPIYSVNNLKLLKIKKGISYFFKNNQNYQNYYPQILFGFISQNKLSFVKFS